MKAAKVVKIFNEPHMSVVKASMKGAALSAVMTVYNDSKNIGRFFNSFLSQTYDVRNIEFVVVDAGSTDGTVKLIKKFQKQLPKLRLISKKCNISEGRNIAIKQTSGDRILTFNSDARLEKDCIEKLVEAIEKYPEAGGIAAMQVYPENQNFLAKCIYFIPGMAQVSLVTTPVLRKKEIVETHSVPCECGIWRREALPPGMFDERFNWGEDSEFHFRMRKKGWKIYGTREAKFEHFYKDTLRKFWRQQTGYGYGAGIFMKLNKNLDGGFRWKKYFALLAPFGFLIWLLITLLHPLLGIFIVLIAILPMLKVGVKAAIEKGLRFLPGVFFVQIVKYAANVVGFWKAITRRSPS